MHYTKILWSLGTITVIGAVTIGITGAFFTDTAESQGNTFSSGTLDLEINPVEASGGWAGTITGGQTPGYGALNPGGDEANLSTRLRNIGTADSEAIGLEVNHTTNENVIAAQMRITQLDWKGESLLEGGAGANLSDYTPPSSCDVTVSSGDSIQTDGIDEASSGETVCVEAGTYTGNITVDKDITVAALSGPNSATPAELDGQFNVVVDGVTIAGFKISNTNGNGSSLGGGNEREGIFVGNATNFINTSDSIVLEYNLIDGVEDNDGSPSTVEGIHVKEYDSGDQVDGVTIRHNVIRNVNSASSGANGMKLQAEVANIDVTNNTIEATDGAWTYGVGLTYSSGETGYPLSINIESNVIDLPDADPSTIAVGLDDVDGSEVTVNRNNFIGEGIAVANINPNGDTNPNNTLDATNNWWGDFDPSDQVAEDGSADVDYDPIAGGPHTGFVGGTDFNGNGFADLQDLAQNPITNATPGLDAGETGDLDFFVQLDGPTTGNSYQDSDLVSDFTFTLGQIVN